MTPRLGIVLLSLLLASCSFSGRSTKQPFDGNSVRSQLSVGYSLLYQEADGIPKLNWLLMFKDKSDDMARLTQDLGAYYEHLAETLVKLAHDYPGVRIDLDPMSKIEGNARKSMGIDLAKDLAPLVGKTGIDFEREALLMFYNVLDEQRHVTKVMAELEPDAGLRKFLETTNVQLDTRYAKVGALLNRRYFTH